MFFKKPKTKIEKRRFADQMGSNETVIAPDTKIKGKITGAQNIRIAGYLEGKITSDAILWIDSQGSLDGPVSARGVIVKGTMNGDIVSSEKTELRSGCQVTGNITCGAIAVAEDCNFHGQIHMKNKADKPHSFTDKRKDS
jgi:cytoskeletal protein CcmA (bactofilin family)